MNKDQKQFFALLRSGLWNTPVDKTLFYGSTDWEVVFKQAKHQTVLGLIVDGINTMPTNIQPPKELLCKMRGKVLLSIRTHAQMNSVLAEVITSLQEKGFCPILLNGQGMAMNYLEPTRRQCGDIDLYIGKQEYERARAFVIERYRSDDNVSESQKHYHFTYKGVVIQLHRIAESLPIPWQNTRFQNWSEKHLHQSNLRSVQLGSTEIKLPPIDFDAIYIFNHAWHHFSAGGGIGLHQLCDWVRYLHKYHHEINLVELECHLKAFGLWRAWRIFGYIAVNVLGLSRTKFPFYTPKYTFYGCNILNMIEEEGNFGIFNFQKEDRPKGYLLGKIQSFKWIHKRLRRLLPIFTIQTSAIWMNYIYVLFKELLLQQPSVIRIIRNSLNK